MNGPDRLAPAAREIPADILCAADYARLAGGCMPAALHAHVEGGSGHDVTAAANPAAFDRLSIVPRTLRRVDGGHSDCALAGRLRPHPIMLAPVGAQALLHQQAERATAMAAAATGTCLIASTMSSLSLEHIASVAGADRWFQLYVQPSRATTSDLVHRAEAAGYAAIIVTVDTPIQIHSFRAQRAGHDPATAIAANLSIYPAAPSIAIAPGQSRILNGLMHRAPDWDDIAWLLRETRLPVWIKGIMHPDDARTAAGCGAAGIVVSNHGGRGLDGAPASLTMLPAVRAALPRPFPILFDGGIRSGADIFKAIALGADAVLIGRLQAFALAVAGAAGVGHMIRLLREELEICMALAGCATLDDIRAARLLPEPTAGISA